MLYGTLTLGFIVAFLPPADLAGDAERAVHYVRLLGSTRFSERQAAFEALGTMGSASLSRLLEAMRHADPEVRRRAEILVRRIRQQQETDRVLRPQLVEFDFREKTLADVVQEIAKETGFRVSLTGTAEDRARSLTVRTGKLPFWEAIDRVWKEVGLVEYADPASTVVKSIGSSPAFRVTGMQPEPSGRPMLNLRIGLEQSIPTFIKGGVRFRALPILDAVRRGNPDSLAFRLEVWPQPSMDVRAIFGFRIDQARDDHDQKLDIAFSPGALTGQVQLANDPDSRKSAGAYELLLRLEAGEKGSRVLRDVKGAVQAQIMAPSEDLVTALHPLQSIGKVFEGINGETLTVMQAKQDEDQKIRLRVQLKETLPQNVAWAANGRVMVRNNVLRRQAVGRGGTGLRNALMGASAFDLQDASGKSFRMVVEEEKYATTPTGVVQEYSLVCSSDDTKMEPTKLIFSGQRLATVEIPFAFAEIPLQ